MTFCGSNLKNTLSLTFKEKMPVIAKTWREAGPKGFSAWQEATAAFCWQRRELLWCLRRGGLIRTPGRLWKRLVWFHKAQALLLTAFTQGVILTNPEGQPFSVTSLWPVTLRTLLHSPFVFNLFHHTGFLLTIPHPTWSYLSREKANTRLKACSLILSDLFSYHACLVPTALCHSKWWLQA